ncbi:hypothetical protein AB9M62_02835 [Bacillales bacterium AN1005]
MLRTEIKEAIKLADAEPQQNLYWTNNMFEELPNNLKEQYEKLRQRSRNKPK